VERGDPAGEACRPGPSSAALSSPATSLLRTGGWISAVTSRCRSTPRVFASGGVVRRARGVRVGRSSARCRRRRCSDTSRSPTTRPPDRARDAPPSATLLCRQRLRSERRRAGSSVIGPVAGKTPTPLSPATGQRSAEQIAPTSATHHSSRSRSSNSSSSNSNSSNSNSSNSNSSSRRSSSSRSSQQWPQPQPQQPQQQPPQRPAMAAAVYSCYSYIFLHLFTYTPAELTPPACRANAIIGPGSVCYCGRCSRGTSTEATREAKWGCGSGSGCDPSDSATADR
jgi:hypothetical protein